MFQDRIVLVTGAGNGIGRGVAEAFAAEGALVYGFDIDSHGLEDTDRIVRERGGRFRALQLDVSKPDDVSRGVSLIQAESGHIDVLVNNAGINMGKRISELELEDWDRVFDVNLRSVYLVCKAVWPIFQSRSAGNIVNMASVMGQVGGVSSPAYCSTKAGIIMLTRCLAKDGASHGIRVNCVCPGYIDTPIMERVFQSMPDPLRARRELSARMPLRRLGTPSDIASGVMFLASAAAAYISGVELTIDGAVTATQID